MSSWPRLPAAPGQTFGRLTVVREVRATWPGCGTSYRAALCRCQCGTLHTAAVPALHAGLVRSCGCLRADTNRARARRPP